VLNVYRSGRFASNTLSEKFTAIICMVALGIPEAQQIQCISVLDKLCSHHISRMFAQPVDPVRDNIPDYANRISRPMDLGTVRQKLLNNQYQSVSQWREDMELIWQNSLLVNSRTSILGNITIEMQNMFRKLSQNITDSPENDWLNKLFSLRDGLNSISRRNQPVSALKREASVPKQLLNRANNQAKVNSKSKNQTSFTKSEILKLTADINSLKDEVHILSIFAVLEKYEPGIKTDGDQLQLDIASLKTSTLNALREKVDQCLGYA
jgi:hypothetical protein